MTTPDINLVQMGHTAISCRDGNILKLNVHVILGFKQLPPIYLAGGDFQSHDMALSLVKKLDRDPDRAGQFAHGSLHSLAD